MRLLRLPLAAAIICCSLVACGSDKAGTTPTSPTATEAAPITAGSAGTQAPVPAGDVDCAALKTALADMSVNWQLVIGFVNVPSPEWASVPLGSLPQFGDQLAMINSALGSDAEAAQSLSFMAGANNIVQRGLAGDTSASADLGEYMGNDITANVTKQLPISIAYQNAGCE